MMRLDVPELKSNGKQFLQRLSRLPISLKFSCKVARVTSIFDAHDGDRCSELGLVKYRFAIDNDETFVVERIIGIQSANLIEGVQSAAQIHEPGIKPEKPCLVCNYELAPVALVAGREVIEDIGGRGIVERLHLYARCEDFQTMARTV